MSSLEMMILALAMSFSTNTSAGNTTEERDQSLERRNSGETMKMRDCLGRNGNDKVLCNKEMVNNGTNAMPNKNSRLNRDRNSKVREDRNSIDSNSRDLNTRDMKPSVTSPNRTQSKDLNSSAPAPTGSTSSDTSTGR